MDTTLDLSRWREAPRPIAYRRWTMISTGLRLLFRARFFKILFAVAWSAGLLIAALGFTFSQSLATGGWLQDLAARLGPRVEALFAALGGFSAMYPDICVGGVFTLIFWLHSFVGLWLSLVALTVMVPRLITRDRATNALIVYLSRPLTSVDYLIGKLGMITGVIGLMWTGPLLFGWLLSMAFATDRDFVVYSFTPLLRALLFNGISLVTIAAIALGVSALSRTSRNTTIIWTGLWLIFAVIASPPRAPDWIRRTSFAYDLGEVRLKVIRLDSALSAAAENLPLLDQRFAANLSHAGDRAQAADPFGAFGSLGVFIVASSFVFFRKLRPE
jgi:ABC-2 type transport system permease protein